MFKPGDIVEWVEESRGAQGSVAVVVEYNPPSRGGVTVDWLSLTPIFARECAERGARWERTGWVQDVFRKIGELPK